jgi:hypothetical protein
MRYDSTTPIALAKGLDSFGDSVKSRRIQCAEALVDEEAVKADGANRLKRTSHG